jgi:polysaccharide biosynthesis/export protein
MLRSSLKIFCLVLLTVPFAGKLLADIAAAPLTPPPLPASDYLIGPGDLLRIAVFDHPEFSLDARVSQSGKVTFPLLGQIDVAGDSTRQVEEILTRRLAAGHYVHSAQTSVLVTEYQSQTISVMGQVVKPGQYALQKAYRVLDVLAQAGGVINPLAVGEEAAADEANLVRQDGTVTRINLHRLFDGDPTQNPAVAAGDTIYVPRAPQFYVYGEVQRPGVYRLESRMTVAQAISEGGGLTPKGSEHRIAVKRVDEQGKEHRYSVKSGDLVQANDVLLVKQGFF